MTDNGDTSGRHRKNAAEWLMWLVLLPAFAVVWAAERLRMMAGSRWRRD